LGLIDNKQGASKVADGNGAAEPPQATGRRTTKPKRRRGSNNGRSSRANATTAAARKARSGERVKALAEIEGDIDRLIFKLMVAGNLDDIEDELRKVRRLLYQSAQV
jgi:hypothetical protein